MKKEDIIYEWISVHSNFNKIPCLEVTEEIYYFLTGTCDMYRTSYGEVFALGGTMLFTLRVKN